MAEHWVCATCGVQHGVSASPPARCAICEDERQYVGLAGQAWTSAAALREKHRNVFHEVAPGVWSIHTEPAFGIGQRAYLIQTGEGNLLWDSLTLTDGESLQRVRELGGVRAIAVSHPHYYSAMVDWSDGFGGVPIYLHEDDREWAVRVYSAIHWWSGEERELFGGLGLVRSGGHFAGYQVAHWAAGDGVLFAGDQPQVCMDGRWVTFMYSYPNWIPFSAAQVRRITGSLAGLRFERMYGAFGRNLLSDAKAIVARSEERYLRAIEG
ncbi:MAG: MBL fold metallo-hydrolase [Bryobacterales bacterium]|nr:MBL fold metallo-hydrolase [Bryobacterales bacterium]